MSNTNNANIGQGSNVAQTEQTISNNAVMAEVMGELTSTKAEKLSLFMPYFKEETETFVRKCSGRGDNAWKKVADKILTIEKADENQIAYIHRIYDEFDLDTPYSLQQLVMTVSAIRRGLGLPIETSGSKWYIQQLSNIFLIEKVMDSEILTKVTGYMFTFKLAPVN